MSTPEPREVYRELGQLAEGGMALVLRAVRESDGTDVVIKRVRPPLCFDAGYLGLFRDEGALHAQLQHAHVVRLIDRGDDEQGPYLVFEHVSGTDLGALLQRAIEDDRPLDLELVLSVAVPLADALAFVHDASCDGQPLGAIHRDVSPANVLLGEDGDVKLADFGVAASRLKTEVTVAGELKGKFAYMAPEQTRGGPVTTSADLFALGVVLWECLANCRLFEAPTDVDVVQQVRHGEAPRLDTLPLSRPVDAAVADIVAELLAKDPSARPASAAVVRDRLLQVAIERGLDDGLRRIVARAVRQAPRRELSPMAPDVRRRTQRVTGMATADTVRRMPGETTGRRGLAAAGLVGLVLAVGVTLAVVVAPSWTATPPPLETIDVLHPSPPVQSPPSPPVQSPPSPPPLTPSPVKSSSPPRPTPTTPRVPRPPAAPPPVAAIVPVGVGHLSLTSEPWGRVLVDGVVVAKETPLVRFALPAGTHVVVVENPVLGLKKTVPITIAPDEHVRRFVDLAAP
jgi:serine/threonine-protein kinase